MITKARLPLSLRSCLSDPSFTKPGTLSLHQLLTSYISRFVLRIRRLIFSFLRVSTYTQSHIDLILCFLLPLYLFLSLSLFSVYVLSINNALPTDAVRLLSASVFGDDQNWKSMLMALVQRFLLFFNCTSVTGRRGEKKMSELSKRERKDN